VQQQPSNKWFDEVKALSIELTKIPSVTDSKEEQAFAQKLFKILQRLPYFQNNPEHLWLETVETDSKKRQNLYALVKKNDSKKTVILSSHYDVVSIDNYGSLEEFAFQPEQLKEKLLKELGSSSTESATQLAIKDLQSDDFLPARGLLDMKSGLAVGIAILRAFSENDSSNGNLLFIATPDEEKSSVGMRDVASRLADISKEHDLDFAAAINLDSTSDHGNGEEGQAIYLGSVGKLLTSMLIVGRETHAGYPLEGINPHLLASYITWAAFNVLNHERTAEEVLGLFKEITERAMGNALEAFEKRAALYTTKSKQAIKLPSTKATILSFAELKSYCIDKLDKSFENKYNTLVNDLQADEALDDPTRSQKITEYLWQQSGLTGPAIIIGFASLHYPAVLIKQDNNKNIDFVNAVETVAESIRKDFDTPISFRNFFAGISDMSWLGSNSKRKPKEFKTVNANTPLTHIHINENTLDIPTLNIGPWGRDYHKKLERVYMPYTFEVLPELVWRTSIKILEDNS